MTWRVKRQWDRLEVAFSRCDACVRVAGGLREGMAIEGHPSQGPAMAVVGRVCFNSFMCSGDCAGVRGPEDLSRYLC